MTYKEWFESHAKRHGDIVAKLLKRGYAEAAIIDYFDFDNMVTAEPDFCPLYAEKNKCHDMERLNCYLCACPYFRFNDTGLPKNTKLNPSFHTHHSSLITYSTCAINAKAGKSVMFGNAVHQDCSQCLLPHRRGFIEKHFDINWKTIMASCPDGR